MNTKVWYLPYFEGVYHTRMNETFSNVNARMVIYGSYYGVGNVTSSKMRHIAKSLQWPSKIYICRSYFYT